MTVQQVLLFLILAGALIGFIWNIWRYDVVACLALLAGVYANVVPMESAFDGFSHPAVITVGAVLVISRALQNTGLIDQLVRLLAPTRRSTTLQVGAGSALAMLLSAVMNNVGALALMLPVTIRNAARARRSVSLLLIPLSFASLLGGLITLIGTPPNLVVAGFREEYTGEPFAMFDFAAVGGVVAFAGLLYLTLFGWHLLPQKYSDTEAARHRRRLEPFLAEVGVPAGSPFAGKRVIDLEDMCENEITVMTILRDDAKILAPHARRVMQVDDILVIEGDPTVWEPLCDGHRFDLRIRGKAKERTIGSDEVVLVEAVVMPGSILEGRSARRIRMHENFGINLLALARQSQATKTRLKNTKFETGDVLLLQGDRSRLERVLPDLGCLILLDRGAATSAGGHKALGAISIFAAAVMAAATGIISVPIALVSAALAMILLKIVSLREAYDSIEWPIIGLLGALIPLGLAMKSTGAASVIADTVTSIGADLPLWAIIAVLLIVSMLLSDLIHNTPTAILMAPVAAGVAESLQLGVDPFLMAVAIGSASPYLTPIGHQSNTLVMGPGRYSFADYTRVGAPLEILIVIIAVPMILFVWT